MSTLTHWWMKNIVFPSFYFTSLYAVCCISVAFFASAGTPLPLFTTSRAFWYLKLPSSSRFIDCNSCRKKKLIHLHDPLIVTLATKNWCVEAVIVVSWYLSHILQQWCLELLMSKWECWEERVWENWDKKWSESKWIVLNELCYKIAIT